MRVFLFCAISFLLGATHAETLFSEGFEGTPAAGWDFTSAPDGRASIRSEFGGAAGVRALALDDAVDDANHSLATATLTLNLRNKKNVTLSFDAKSLGNEPHFPDERFLRPGDAVLISTDGGLIWRVIYHLSFVSESWQRITLPLDSWLWSFNAAEYPGNFKIRFACYENASAPFDGIAIDEVTVTGEPDQRAMVEVPRYLIEGSAPATGRVLLSIPPTNAVTLQLSVTGLVQVTAPPTITIPAGQTSASFQFSPLDDTDLNLAREIMFFVSGQGIATNSAGATVLDDETATISVHLPGRIKEGEAETNAFIRLSRAPTLPWTVNLTEIFPAEVGQQLSYSGSVIGEAGKTEVRFGIAAFEDNLIENSVETTLRASILGLQDAVANIIVDDNESRVLQLNVQDSVKEGQSIRATIALSGYYPSNLVVTIEADAQLEVTNIVEIAPYSTSWNLPLTIKDNAIRDGVRSARITLRAEGFTPSTRTIEIVDDEVPSYQLTPIFQVAVIGASIQVGINAADDKGLYFPVPDGHALNVSVVLPDGSELPASPPRIALTNSAWSGSIRFPDTTNAPLRLRFSDGSTSVETVPFDLMRILPLQASAVIWDPLRSRLYAAISAADRNRPNQVVAIEPATGSIVRFTAVAPNPLHLGITSGHEFLYVASSNGSISRINLDTFAEAGRFNISSNTETNTLQASDIATVKDRPELLVAARRRNTLPSSADVALFSNGVQLPGTTTPAPGSTLIEPSADPNIFFAVNSEVGSTFQRLRLTEMGISAIDSTPELISTANGSELKSEGNLVVSSAGEFLNGAEKKILGSFRTTGSPALELALNRVYFLETPPLLREFRLAAYDAQSLVKIREETLPILYSTVANLVRWGSNGFSFVGDQGLAITYSPLIAPSPVPADLSVTVDISPTNALGGDTLSFVVRATNNSANPAPNTLLTLRIRGSGFRTVTTTAGQLKVYPLYLVANIPNLAPHSEVVIYALGDTLYAGGVSAQATVTSSAFDPNMTNNTFGRISGVGFQGGHDTFNLVHLGATSLENDPARGVVWVSAVSDPFGSTVIDLNPYTGRFGEPIRTDGEPSIIALSKNGRYLYVGFSDLPEVHRIDLATRQIDLRIALSSESPSPVFAEDIEVLEGAGTSILVSLQKRGFGPQHQGVAVYDNAVRRPLATPISAAANQIEPTAAPDVFIGMDRESIPANLSKLLVTAEGIQVSKAVGLSPAIYNPRIHTDNSNIIFASNGSFIDAVTLNTITNLGAYAFPLLDVANDRAFLLNSSSISAVEISTARYIDALQMDSRAGFGAIGDAVRFGEDGFVIENNTGLLIVARWSLPFPETVGPRLVNPQLTSAGQLRFSATTLRIEGAEPYAIWASNDLKTWTPLQSGWTRESVGINPVNNFIYETFQYTITETTAEHRYFRLGRAASN